MGRFTRRSRRKGGPDAHGPGLDKFIEDRVDDLAHHGYAAAAPDLYHRQPEDGADMMARIGRLRDKEIIADAEDRKSTRLNSSHANISYAVFCLKKKK